MDKNPAMLEKRALLEETSSEEDSNDEEMAFNRGKNILNIDWNKFSRQIKRLIYKAVIRTVLLSHLV